MPPLQDESIGEIGTFIFNQIAHFEILSQLLRLLISLEYLPLTFNQAKAT